MKVWELISELSKMPSGADLEVLVEFGDKKGYPGAEVMRHVREVDGKVRFNVMISPTFHTELVTPEVFDLGGDDE